MKINLSELHHRDRTRVKELGEVFTPESYVEEMLDLIGKDKKNFWSDEDVVFFEPCCGHGNIVVPIIRRRLNAIYKKALSQGFAKRKDASLYAVANALNTLWAIDIDSKNIENTRSRVLFEITNFLKEKLELRSNKILIEKNKEYFTHVLSAIKWHISENETLSALSSEKNAKNNATLTKAGAKWFSKNGHNELDFDLTWGNFFESCENSNTLPLEYVRSAKCIDSFLTSKFKGFEEFNFAKVVLTTENKQNLIELGA